MINHIKTGNLLKRMNAIFQCSLSKYSSHKNLSYYSSLNIIAPNDSKFIGLISDNFSQKNITKLQGNWKVNFISADENKKFISECLKDVNLRML